MTTNLSAKASLILMGASVCLLYLYSSSKPHGHLEEDTGNCKVNYLHFGLMIMESEGQLNPEETQKTLCAFPIDGFDLYIQCIRIICTTDSSDRLYISYHNHFPRHLT